MQLACVLHMVPGWKNSTKVRVFMCVDSKIKDVALLRKQWEQILQMLRIEAFIQVVIWDHIMSPLDQSLQSSMTEVTIDSQSLDTQSPVSEQSNGGLTAVVDESPQRFVLTDNYLANVNVMIQEHSYNTSVLFMYLPPPPVDSQVFATYLHRLDILTKNLPPTLLVHGINPVTSTTL